MTPAEFSDGFDQLVNSYSRFKSFDNRETFDSIEFDEYQKSLFLTKAQEELVLHLYDGKNIYGESFELTEELRRYLSSLVKEATLSSVDDSGTTGMGNSKFFHLPEDLWFITYEQVEVSDAQCEGASILDVIPITQDEYHKVKRNPFRGANMRRALRLDLSNNIVEIVSKQTVSSYYIRYMKELKPIILRNLPDGLTIKGLSNITPCELHEGLHYRILEEGVRMALQSKSIGTSKNINRE